MKNKSQKNILIVVVTHRWSFMDNLRFCSNGYPIAKHRAHLWAYYQESK